MSIRFSTGAIDACLNDGAFKTVFENGVIYIFSGTQPSSADDVETGDTLAIVTESGLTFTPGTATNGLNFGDSSGGVISKASGETWTGDFIADGTMGWFRLYCNLKTTGASTTAIRIDGSIGTSRSDAIVASRLATIGGSADFNNFQFTITII